MRRRRCGFSCRLKRSSVEGELDTALLCIALLFLLVKRGANLLLLAELVTYWFCGIFFAGTCWRRLFRRRMDQLTNYFVCPVASRVAILRLRWHLTPFWAHAGRTHFGQIWLVKPTFFSNRYTCRTSKASLYKASCGSRPSAHALPEALSSSSRLAGAPRISRITRHHSKICLHY